MPVFLANTQSNIDSLESSNLCTTVYPPTAEALIQNCETVYDEIMKRGFTQTLYTIYNYAQSLQVRFKQ